MTSENDSRLESVRKRVIEKHEEAHAPEDLGEALLAIGFMLSFFGSAAVLMPSQGSPTGLFSGEFELQSPDVETAQIRNVDASNSRISFVHDAEVQNPNIVATELDQVIYEIKINGNTVARGTRDGSTVIGPDSIRNVATSHYIDLSGVSGGDEIYQDIISGDQTFTVEGAMEFNTDGGMITETFSRSYRLDLEQ